jgi:SAM-dependent methyltransferase
MLRERVKDLAKRRLSERTRRRLRRLTVWPPAGRVRFGSFRRTRPISGLYDWRRGQPIDRYYIERFLSAHAADIRGAVLEIGDAQYTRRHGRGVTGIDVLHVDEGNPEATIVADLADAPQIASDSFDCVVCVQTLLLVYDVRAAIATLRRILKPGGVVLATFPGIARINRREAEEWGDFWRFTAMSARRLFEEAFGEGRVEVETRGNVLAAASALHGLAAEDLGARRLDPHDPDYEVLIGVRATSP